MRKILTILASVTVVALLVVFGSPTSARGGQPPKLEKLTFIHYADPEVEVRKAQPTWGPYGAACPAVDDDDENDTYHKLYGGIRWLEDVGYEFSGSVSSAQEDGINNAFGTWNDVVDSTFSASEEKDSDNIISFGSIDGTGGILAITTIWFNPATKQISAFSMDFDSDDTWSTSGEEGKFDVQNVAAHEIGHVAGLGHDNSPKDCWLTMYKYSQEGETAKRSLGSGEILGLQELY